MRYIIILILSVIALSCYSQTDITNGMSGRNARNAINGNFDTVYNYTDGYYNVKDFGAVGDGSNLDNTAIESAINAAKTTNRAVYFPQGTYRCDTSISITGLTKNDYIEIIGAGNVILDFSNITDYYTGGLVFESDTIVGVDVTYDVAGGDTLFYADLSGKGVVRDDIVQFYSTDAWSTNAKRGEYLKIRQNIGDTIFSVYKGFVDDYTAASTSVQPTNMASLKISNITIIYDSIWHGSAFSPSNIKCINMRDVLISYVRSHDNRTRNFDMQNCYNVTVENCVTYETDRLGKGYGVHAAGSQHVEVSNCMFDAVRHGFTTDAGIYHSMPARFCNVHHCTVSGTRGNSTMLDTHPESEYITFEYNEIFGGGIGIRDHNTTVRYNTLYVTDNSSGWIAISNNNIYEEGFYEIIGNRNVDLGEGSPTAFIAIYGYINTTMDRVVISGNTGSSSSRPMLIQGNVQYLTINELHINDNILTKTGSGDYYAVVFIDDDDIKIGKLFMDNNKLINETPGTNSLGVIVAIDTVSYAKMTNNYITSVNSDYLVRIVTTNDIPQFIYSYNNHDGGGAATFANINKLIYQNNISNVGTSIPNTVDSLWIMGNVNLDGTAVSNSAGWVYNSGNPW